MTRSCRPHARIAALCCEWFVVVSASLSFMSARPACAQDAAPRNADEVRQRIESRRLELQTLEKNRSLRQSALEVTRQRMDELRRMLEDLNARAASEELQVAELEQQKAMVSTAIADLEQSVARHAEADQLQLAADRAEQRLNAVREARTALEIRLADLRKSAVEWNSRAAEAQQQLAAAQSQMADAEKAAGETRTAMEAAVAGKTAAEKTLADAAAIVETETKALQTEQTQLDAAAAAARKIEDSAASLRTSITMLTEAAKLTGVDPKEATAALEAAATDLLPLQKNAAALIITVTERRDAANARLAAATTDVEKAQAALAAATAAAEQAIAASTTAADKLTMLRTTITNSEKSTTESQSWQTYLNAQVTALEPSLQKLTAEMRLVSANAVRSRHDAQAALEPLGRFVSFSRDIAPILARRCTACHNTRSPGGRLNLDSYSALGKGGESGPTVSPHHSTDSLLISMVEDGSMPKDADPLTGDEIAMLRRWIDVGAPLDAGLSASAELFDVMPEVSQPLPPDSYRVPIPVTATAFSPNGELLATSGYHEILVWNTADGSLARRITNVAQRVYDLEFSQDGSQLAVAAGTPGQLGETKLFSVADGSLIRTLTRARDSVLAVSFSPDGSRIASAGADRTIVVTQADSGLSLVVIEDHADWVMDVNWSPDGKKLVSSSRDKTCKVFDAATGDPQITFNGHGEPVYSAAFLGDSQTIASGGADRRVRIWNSADAKEVRAIGGFGGDVFRVSVVPGDHLLTACADRTAREHNAADGAAIRSFAGHNDWVYTLCYNAARKLVATGSYDGEIRLWNEEDGSMTTSFYAVPVRPADATVADR